MKNDDAYDNRGYVDGVDAIVEVWTEAARTHRETEATLGRARLNEPYGDHPREAMDIFHPKGRAEGLVVFIHGGYWRAFDRSFWSHLSTGCTERDWAFAMPSYPLAPEVGIDRITRSTAAAITRAANLVSGPIALVGHSAGGHLVARMACGDADLPPNVAERIRVIVPISPVTDLRPLIETKMNDDFLLDEDRARAESPALMEKSLDVPVHIHVGGDERPAFLDQARWLHEAWADTTLTIAERRHHFDVIEPLADAESELVTQLTG